MTIVDLGVPLSFQVLTDSFESLVRQKVIERYSLTGRQITLYFREMPGGKPVRFSYQMRPKFPVKVKTPPAAVYQYYEPEVRAEAPPHTHSALKRNLRQPRPRCCA